MKFIRPKKIPEANIQAEIYKNLRDLKIKCCLEYRFKTPLGYHMRADVAVIKDGFVICFIECKSRKDNRNIYKDGRQYKGYMSTGVETIYCMAWDEIKETIRKIKNIHRLYT